MHRPSKEPNMIQRHKMTGQFPPGGINRPEDLPRASVGINSQLRIEVSKRVVYLPLRAVLEEGDCVIQRHADFTQHLELRLVEPYVVDVV